MISAKQAVLAGYVFFCTAGNVLSFPLQARQSAISDVDILQFALTLEHLENTFYKQALTNFSVTEFTAAGFDQNFLTNLDFIAHDEEQHVVLLESAITAAGATPVAACTYKFPTTDVASFVSLATVLEGVGVSAYLGAATAISSKAILNVAAAITVSEGLHQAIQRASILDVTSANIAGTPLSPNAIFTLASGFIESCPTSNAALPFKAFPTLSLSNSSAPLVANTVATLNMAPGSTTAVPASAFVTFISGLDIISVPATMSAAGEISATIPPQVSGQSFGLLTSTSLNGTGTIFDDSTVIAGPVIMEVVPAAPTVNFSIL